jgi:hypothetical protein
MARFVSVRFGSEIEIPEWAYIVDARSYEVVLLGAIAVGQEIIWYSGHNEWRIRRVE